MDAKNNYNSNADTLNFEISKPLFSNAVINTCRVVEVRGAMIRLNNFHLSAYSDKPQVQEVTLDRQSFDRVYNQVFVPSIEFFKRFSDIEPFFINKRSMTGKRFGFTRTLFGQEIQTIRFVLGNKKGAIAVAPKNEC